MRILSGLDLVAMKVCHEFGMDWYDPITGEKYPAPKVKREVTKYRRKTNEKSNRDKSRRGR